MSSFIRTHHTGAVLYSRESEYMYGRTVLYRTVVEQYRYTSVLLPPVLVPVHVPVPGTSPAVSVLPVVRYSCTGTVVRASVLLLAS